MMRRSCCSSHSALLALAASLAWGPGAGAAGPEATIQLDCGVNALYVLLQLEGRAVPLDRLLAALPARHPQGHSMAELAQAARDFGVSLDGVRFGKGDRALDRPAIAFWKDARGGHFAVLRPVGTTGTMVQVIDPPHPPRITDYDRLFDARTWTGRVLLAAPPWNARRATMLLLLAVPVFGILRIALAAARRRRCAAT